MLVKGSVGWMAYFFVVLPSQICFLDFLKLSFLLCISDNWICHGSGQSVSYDCRGWMLFFLCGLPTVRQPDENVRVE